MQPGVTVRRAAARARGSATLAAALVRDRRVPYLPRTELEALRDGRLRETVRYAAETVPYYRELFRRESIDPREIVTAADLERLPIIQKRDVQTDPERFRSESPLGRQALAFRTSGSTGMPLTVYHDERSLLLNMVWSERQRRIEARFAGRRLRYLKVTIEWAISPTGRVRAAYRRNAVVSFGPRRVTLPVERPLEDNIAAIDRLRPDVLWGYGAYIETLFRLVAARGLPMALPKVVVYGSDTMSDEGRRFIESRFGVPVLSHYNAIEAFKLGFVCEHRRGFHLHEDLCVVRLVDQDGRTVPPGERGEVVISNLVNRGTVLLNYRLGDGAVRSDAPCACGRTLPLLDELTGRIGDFVRRSDGRLVTSGEITKHVIAHEGVLCFQLVQHEPRRFELRLETATPAAYERIQAAVVPDLTAVLGGDVVIEPVHHDRIQAGPNGKFKRVFSLFDAARDL